MLSHLYYKWIGYQIINTIRIGVSTFVLYSKLNYKRRAKRLERMDKFIMDLNRFCYNVQTSAKWFVFVFVSLYYFNA